MPRIVVDTDDVRMLAQYTRGAIEQVARIRLELMRAERDLNHQAGADAYGPLLARLTDLLTVLSDDHRMLVQEVLTLEAEEGVASGPTWTDGNRADPGITLLELPRLLLTPLVLGATGATPPPAPWNTTWVTAGGVIPVGAPTRPLAPAEQPGSQQDGFGPRWDTRSVDAGFSHDEGIRSSSGQNPDGSQYGSWEAYQRLSAGVHVSGEGSQGDLHYKGAAGAEAEGAAKVHVWYEADQDRLALGGEASAEAHVHAYATGEASVDGVGSVSGQAEADAGARAEASGKASVSPDGVSVGYEAGAYAGTEASAGGSIESGSISTGYGARVGAGVGVEAKGEFSFDFDDIGFDYSTTLGLGLSLGIDLELHISPSGIIDGLGDVIDGAGALLEGENPFEDSTPALPDAIAQAADEATAMTDQATAMADQAGQMADRAGQMMHQVEAAAGQATGSAGNPLDPRG